MTVKAEAVSRSSFVSSTVAALRRSRLIRQNAIMFGGGLAAGILGFVYHLIAGRFLGKEVYGQVASLVAIYGVAFGVTQVTALILARYAATLEAGGDTSALHHLMVRTTRLGILPSLVALALFVLLAPFAASFLHLPSPVPIYWLGAAVVVAWQVGVPRGMLQGAQRFEAYAVNQTVEMVVRTGGLALFLILGLGVSGSMIALLAGAACGYTAGMVSLRDVLASPGGTVRLRSMAGFTVTAAIGTFGILFLYNNDVILAKHYLTQGDAGIYGALNKIETIIYFLTLPVSQVLYPRVVEAIAKNSHPARVLLTSCGLIALLGGFALAVFAVEPKLVVNVLYGPKFAAAAPYMVPIGLIGLAISLNNLLVFFFMAAHDHVFIPIVAGAVLLQGVLIFLMHASLSQVVTDVLATLLLLLAALAVRCLLLLPRLRPEMVADEP